MRNQKGTSLLAAIVLAGAVVLIGSTILYMMKQASTNLIRTSNSDSLCQVTAALQFYAQQNKDSLINNKRINGFGNPNSPTVAELQTQLYLTATGIDITAPFQSTYVTTVTANPNGSITGFVYLAGNVVDNLGNVSPDRACGIARKIGDAGFCSTIGNGNFIGNGTVQLPNPAGSNIATIAGYIFVPS